MSCLVPRPTDQVQCADGRIRNLQLSTCVLAKPVALDECTPTDSVAASTPTVPFAISAPPGALGVSAPADTVAAGASPSALVDNKLCTTAATSASPDVVVASAQQDSMDTCSVTKSGSAHDDNTVSSTG